ncbi:HNH endonuclease [Micromonospora tarensis]|uniref:HNH endonuclease n=1 Tax=Micromonospora tarensis TaxID=2806100 RepID=A0ABS1YQG6_9ACTN|nr:HNH endonuclease [Micromonospora tarensis]MBM0279678.1 HNH endonuclease [Micromonospora tarensis]
MAKRTCLDCGALTNGTRCIACQRPRERAALRTKRERRPRTSYAEDKRRAAAVAAHRREQGDWCPGWKRDPHKATDLTADHIDAVAAGGSEGGELQVLCRSCNSAKGAR